MVQRSGVQFLVEGPAPQWGKMITGAVDAQQEPDTCSRWESLVMSPGFFSYRRSLGFSATYEIQPSLSR